MSGRRFSITVSGEMIENGAFKVAVQSPEDKPAPHAMLVALALHALSVYGGERLAAGSCACETCETLGPWFAKIAADLPFATDSPTRVVKPFGQRPN